MSEETREQDQTRLCPTCRMPISILAIKCRHCGASVGRPRKEQAELTVEDLGGERRTSYTLSGNVIDALEAFRAEAETQREIEALQKSQSGTWFGRGKKEQQQKIDQLRTRLDSGLPSLDPLAEDLSASLSRSASSSGIRKKTVALPPAGPAITKKLFTFAAVTAGLVLLVLFTSMAYGRIRQYLDERNRVPDRVSQAQEMLNAGKPSIDALKEAVAACAESNTERNRESLQMARTVFMRDIERKLDEKEYSRVSLDEASKMVGEAFAIDRDAAMTRTYEMVQKEVADHHMRLMGAEGGPSGDKTAKIQIQTSSTTTEVVTVAVNDLIQGRFRVTLIANDYVLMKDAKRHERGLKLHIRNGLMKNT